MNELERAAQEESRRYPVSRRGFLGGVLGGAAAGVVVGGVAEAAEYRHVPVPPRSAIHTDRQWSDFLAEQDLIWKRPPRYWFDAPFLGNGRIGTMLYQPPGTNVLRLDVHHSEVQDHRPEFGSTWGLARLPIGHFTLDTVGAVTGVDLRLDLWNAELRGTVTTSAGTLTILVAAVNDRSVLVVSARPSEGERAFRWTFHPAEAVSPRIKFQPIPDGYTGNPPPVLSTAGDVQLVTQPLLSGGEHVTAYHRVRDTLYVNVAHSNPEKTAAPRATAAVRRASAVPVSALLKSHQRWWHRFYRRSFLSVPDQRLQSFYWIQLYKLAAATREDAPVMATPGPWLQDTPWPAVWWNLNVQLEYWPMYGANHLELDAITRTLSENRQKLVDALPEPYRVDSMGIPRTTDMTALGGTVGIPGQATPTPELGNLTWALHNVWLTYRHTMDDDLLRDTLFPLLRKAINYYLHFLTPGEDGKLHLGPTFSPEYGVLAPDCNYDLSLIRWGCQTLLDSARRLRVTDPLAPRWQQVLRDLVPYPMDENGYMIGAGVPFAKSHRHYSHLLMVYPLYEITGATPAQRSLIETSLRHWISFEGALQGYSFTGAASISALLGKGNDALAYLGELLRRFIKPNTMYQESGPVIETPLSAAQSLHDLLVQSWGGVIRVFPAVPDAWKDVTVHDFQTEGAFAVSAVRKGGVTQFVRVRSNAGEPCRVRPGIDGRLTVRGAWGPVRWRDLGDGVIEIDLDCDDEVVIYRAGTRPDFVIAPVPISAPGEPWGLRPLPPVGESVPLDLTALFNNDGVSSGANRTDGNFDGAGFTYPVEDLPPAGETVYDQVRFVFPGGADGSNNNVVARKQVLNVPAGRYAKLRILGAGGGGNVRTTATATYADGSTGEVLIELSNWVGAPFFNEAEILRTKRRHGPPPTNGDAANAAIFHQVAALDAAKELRSITLPNQSRLHFFALTLEKPLA
jgi:alpha-L-fucosidase 2